MPVWAGQIITAGQINRIQPIPYSAVGSGTLTGPQTNADVVGATVTLTTLRAGATYKAWCVWDVNVTAAATGTWLGRMALGGVGQSPLATMSHPTSGGRSTPTQTYHGTLATAGTYTFKLIASPLTSQVVQGVNCSILVEITEVV
ncbi:hypothetical protein ACN24K_01800 [Streptomyces microflavus]